MRLIEMPIHYYRLSVAQMQLQADKDAVKATNAGIRHILVSEGIPWNKSFPMADQIIKLLTEE